ncbi:ROK family protein [Novosphingobium sp. BL-52-GroH]|uniref:ROK family protein n=1 Tax=Novosphingobium sp. BL-52-GroH TaxID=3349877 RepID=UPI00384D4DFE
MRLSDQEFNRLLLLKKLRAAEPVARTELVALTGLTGGTITAITSDLVKRGIVIEEKVVSSSAGRPRVNLRINPAGKYVIGTTATGDGHVLTEIVNLRGESLGGAKARLATTTRIENLAEQFVAALENAIGQSQVRREDIFRIGIGLPGIVDSRTGTVEQIVTFEPGPCDFGGIVARALGIPTLVDNNINLLARGEHWYGAGAHADDFTLINIDLAIGASLYREGQLISGAHGIASEFGHTKIVPDIGRPCFCGARGCLQAYCSVQSITQQSCEHLGRPSPSYETMNACFARLMGEHAAAEIDIWPVLEQASHYLGVAVANHITMQDPEAIIIMGPPMAMMDRLRGTFFAALEQNTFPALRRRTKLHFKVWDKSAYARGAAAMVLEQVYARS